ncbi:1-phosphofructokinase [Lapidilactobacillus mulanensis]|uniref:Tagatose-6-phosphate kinase n=1 Tax=Lapidilactobacillus mulanensis TaxID=2485999 RepID=A0ABW4DPH3_9LACO|nr:1-phosphofructokinase [Lapidilactobacillus mulanensis]
MIYTVTVNPAIDYVVQTETLNLGRVNRPQYTNFIAGGKGINVSKILNQLDSPNTAWGFLGGFTGEFLKTTLTTEKIKSDFTPIAANTRVNVKLKSDVETELNAAGPQVTAAELATFKVKFDQVQPGDIVIFSGSLLPQLTNDFYLELIDLVVAKQAQFAIDTTGQALLDTLAKQPLVIKPNHHELADLFHTTIHNDDELLKYAAQLHELGANHVLISMAGAGAYLLADGYIYHSAAPKGQVVNSVGAGDSMLAGYIGEFTKHQDPELAFKYGLACGSATAFTENIATIDQINHLLPQIKIEKIS